MASDASIYGMLRPQPIVPLENPQDIQAKKLRINQLMGQEEMQRLQLDQTRRGIADDEAASAAYRESAGEPKRFLDLLRQRGLVRHGTAAEKAALEAEAKRGEIGKTGAQTAEINLKNEISKVERVTSILATAKDQGSYDMALRAIANQFGPNAIEGKPPQFDPGFVQATIAGGMTLKQQLEDRRKQQEIAETGRHNLATEGNQAGQLRVAQGQLAETRANNQRPVYDMERGGFASRPQPGKESTFIPATGAPPGQKQIIASREDTDKLRQEFEAKPSVKNYRDVIPIAAAGRNAPDTRSGDIQMAYAVGKILDPNSVVREGELKLVGDAATVMGKIEGELRTLTQGKGRLTPETRTALNAMLSNAVEQRKASYEAEKGSYGGIVQRRGYKPEDVFIDVPEDRRAATTASESKVVNGKTYVKQNGQWFERN